MAAPFSMSWAYPLGKPSKTLVVSNLPFNQKKETKAAIEAADLDTEEVKVPTKGGNVCRNIADY